jgi:predicted transposase YbfD/YdcC
MRSIAKKTLVVAKETGNDVIVQVKKNQKILWNDCQYISKTTEPDDVYQEPLSKSRNRLESRQVSIFFYPLLTDLSAWGLVKVIIKVARYRRVFQTKTKTWKVSDETSFFISTIDLTAQAFCQAIRAHWAIENRDHHVRDVILGEDKSRIRINAGIFSTLRSFALNILRKNKVTNVSLALYDNSLKFDNVLNYVGVLQN